MIRHYSGLLALPTVAILANCSLPSEELARSRTQALVECDGLPSWSVGTYQVGDQVKHEETAYSCKIAGWCGQAAYEPGGTPTWPDAWRDAWEELGSCSTDPGGSGGSGSGGSSSGGSSSGGSTSTGGSSSTGEQIEAEDYNSMTGIQLEQANTTTPTVGYFDAGDWLRYDDVEMDGVTGLRLRMASANSGGVIEVRTGSPNGELLASLTVQSTGGWFLWNDVELMFTTPSSGMQSLYIVGASGSGIANLDYFTLLADVTPGTCGDGVVNGGEQCDDGNLDDSDACNRDCSLTAPFSAFDSSIQNFLNQNGVPGAVAALAHQGKLKHVRAFGTSDANTQAPLDPDARFRIASVSKPITSVAIHKLVESGLLSFQDKVWEVLALDEPLDQDWKLITIDHLLMHTSGFNMRRDLNGDPQPDANGIEDTLFDNIEIANFLNITGPADVEDIVEYQLKHRNIQNLPTSLGGPGGDRTPGTVYEYNNFNYLLLSLVIEKITGQSYSDYLKDEILDGMGATRLELGRSLPADRPADEVSYFDQFTTDSVFPPTTPGAPRDQVPWPDGGFYIESMVGAGGWTSSAVDLVRFLNATDGFSTVEDLLSSASTAHMLDPAVFDDGTPVGQNYARGWGVSGSNWGHVGGFAGTSSVIRRRDNEYNYVLITNRRVNGIEAAADVAFFALMEANTQSQWPDDLMSRYE